MIKHPAFRVRRYNQIATEVRGRIRDICISFRDQFPAGIIDDFEVVGSYARGSADFHSDLDINIATGTPDRRLATIKYIKNNRDLFDVAMKKIRLIYKEYGVRFDLTLEEPSMKDITEKCCWRIIEGRAYHPLATVRVDKQTDGTYLPRPTPNRIRPPKLYFGSVNAEGEYVNGLDPWADIVEVWRTRYGANFLEIGSTPETAHYNG